MIDFIYSVEKYLVIKRNLIFYYASRKQKSHFQVLQLMGALYMGNHVTLKPSGNAAMVMEEYLRLMLKCGMPPGDVNMLHALGEPTSKLVEAACKEKHLRAMQFTGSNKVAQHLCKLTNGEVYFLNLILLAHLKLLRQLVWLLIPSYLWLCWSGVTVTPASLGYCISEHVPQRQHYDHLLRSVIFCSG